MNQVQSRLEKFDSWLMNWLSMGVLLFGVFLLLWASSVFFFQCIGWIKAGEWQPVAFGTLFLSDSGQASLQTIKVSVNPLELVPSWGTSFELEQVATIAANKLLGMRKIMAWLLETPLNFWLAGLGFLTISVSSEIAKSRLPDHG